MQEQSLRNSEVSREERWHLGSRGYLWWHFHTSAHRKRQRSASFVTCFPNKLVTTCRCRICCPPLTCVFGLCVAVCVLVCVSDPFNKKREHPVWFYYPQGLPTMKGRRRMWGGMSEKCLEWQTSIGASARRRSTKAVLYSAKYPPPPCTTSLTASSVPSRWSLVVKAATPSICGPRKKMGTSACCSVWKSLMFPVGVWQ